MSPGVPRPLAALFICLLSGCAGAPAQPDDHGHAWVRDGLYIPREAWRYHYVEQAEIWTRCTVNSRACAVRFAKGRLARCDIYLPRSAQGAALENLRSHEERHCAGWSHPALS